MTEGERKALKVGDVVHRRTRGEYYREPARVWGVKRSCVIVRYDDGAYRYIYPIHASWYNRGVPR